MLFIADQLHHTILHVPCTIYQYHELYEPHLSFMSGAEEHHEEIDQKSGQLHYLHWQAS